MRFLCKFHVLCMKIEFSRHMVLLSRLNFFVCIKRRLFSRFWDFVFVDTCTRVTNVSSFPLFPFTQSHLAQNPDIVTSDGANQNGAGLSLVETQWKPQIGIDLYTLSKSRSSSEWGGSSVGGWGSGVRVGVGCCRMTTTTTPCLQPRSAYKFKTIFLFSWHVFQFSSRQVGFFASSIWNTQCRCCVLSSTQQRKGAEANIHNFLRFPFGWQNWTWTQLKRTAQSTSTTKRKASTVWWLGILFQKSIIVQCIVSLLSRTQIPAGVQHRTKFSVWMYIYLTQNEESRDTIKNAKWECSGGSRISFGTRVQNFYTAELLCPKRHGM